FRSVPFADFFLLVSDNRGWHRGSLAADPRLSASGRTRSSASDSVRPEADEWWSPMVGARYLKSGPSIGLHSAQTYVGSVSLLTSSRTEIGFFAGQQDEFG